MTDADWAREKEVYGACIGALQQAGVLVATNWLQPAMTATTLSVRDGRTRTRDPAWRFADPALACPPRTGPRGRWTMRFDRMRPAELRAAVDQGLPFVLPIGVMEYHGQHLPSGVDMIVVTEILDRLGDAVVVLPPFAYGAASHAVARPEDGATLHVDAAAILPFAEALFASLLAGGYRNIHGIVHHQTENFHQGMPTDLVFRLAARNAIFRHLEATRGAGWWGAADMADYYDQHEAGADPFAWIQVHPLFPKGADFPFDHAGEGETALMLALAPESVDLGLAEGDGHWFTDTAPRATAERGARGVEIALTHLRRVLGLDGPADARPAKGATP